MHENNSFEVHAMRLVGADVPASIVFYQGGS